MKDEREAWRRANNEVAALLGEPLEPPPPTSCRICGIMHQPNSILCPGPPRPGMGFQRCTVTEEDLFFVEVRNTIPVWEVRQGAEDGPVLARVVERVVSLPMYRISREGKPDVDVDTREDVIRVILEGA